MIEARAGDVRLGRVGGIEVIFTPMAAAGSILLFVVFAAMGGYLFKHGAANSVLGAIALVIAHWVSEVAHNLGHATAARRSGHPMTATRLGFLLVLGASLYPPDEPELPAELHVRRALGGPAGSALLTVISGFVLLALAGTSVAWVALLWFLDNLLVFTLGAFVPLGFNDGSTLLRWMGRRGQGTGA